MTSSKQQLKMVGTIVDQGSVETNLPPWPEWSDSYVNTVSWGNKAAKRSAINSSTLSRRSRFVSAFEEELFEDPAGLLKLPADVRVHSWKRSSHIDSTINFVLEPDVSPLDLMSHNQHLLNFKIMRLIIAGVACLEREAFHRPFPVEFQTEQFVATGDPEWKPWHHIYCHSPVGKRQTHSVQYNKNGKYLVRLFHLGKWRRVMVDDWFPFDEEGRLLLPISRPDNLWLPVLAKALLRVAALSWQPDDHSVDFSVVHCLTGWIPTSVPCRGCSQYQLWCVCSQLMPSTEDVVRSPGGCISDQGFKCPQDESVVDLPAVGSRVIFGLINPHVSRSPKQTASMEHLVLISNARYNGELPSPLWKEYRWKEWAYNKGLISDMSSKPVRNIQIYNPLINLSLTSTNRNDVEYWMDFDAFTLVTSCLEVFYKPSYFKYSLRAWSVPELVTVPHTADDVLDSGRGRQKATGKKDSTSKPKSKSPEPDKTEKATTLSSQNNQTSSVATKSKSEKNKSPKEKGKRLSIRDWPSNSQSPALFYLSIDSMYCKQVYICMSAYDPDCPTYAHIVTGKLEWHSPTVAPIVFMLSTSATKGHVFTLSQGFHVFRIWHQFPAHFCLQIYSNTLFSTGSKMNIHQVLASDSISYKFYGKEISYCVRQLLEAAQGGAEHGQAYNQLMSCLQPPQLTAQLPWPHWLTASTEIAQAFEESLTEMLVESLHSPLEIYQTLQAFKMLLLNPVFGEQRLLDIRSDLYYYIQERRISKLHEETLLEAEKKKSAQGGGKKDKSPKEDNLKKGKAVNSVKNTEPSLYTAKTGKTITRKENKKDKGKPAREGAKLKTLLQCKEKNLMLCDPINVILLLKKMMTKVPHLRQLYPFSSENDHRFVFHDYIGELRVRREWVVLVRCVLNLHSSEAVPCSLHVWTPLEKMMLRLINNDTHQDVPLGFVENNVAYLSKNQDGYTVVVYGVAGSESVPWRMRSIGVSEVDLLHVHHEINCLPGTQPPEQTMKNLHGYYVPNKEMVIARCLLEVLADVTVLLRLHLSCSTAFCSLTIFDEEGNSVRSTTGSGHIIIPILKLKGLVGSSCLEPRRVTLQHTTYLVEVRLLDNSWPLSEDQRDAMLYYKEHLPDILLNKADDYLEENLTSTSQQSSTNVEMIFNAFFENVEKPTWNLTVVTDSQKVSTVNLRLDTSLFDHLRLLKAEWESEGMDPSHCQQLREQFLRQQSEDEGDLSEEAVFHKKSKKIDELTQLYGRKSCVTALEPIKTEGKSVVDSFAHLTVSDSISYTLSAADKSTGIHTSYSKEPSTTLSDHSERDVELELDHRNVMVQQAGIHKALENISFQNMVHFKGVFEELARKRVQLLNTIRAANEENAKKENIKSDTPKGKQSLGSSPEKSGKKQSLKGTKKPKSVKGKAK